MTNLYLSLLDRVNVPDRTVSAKHRPTTVLTEL